MSSSQQETDWCSSPVKNLKTTLSRPEYLIEVDAIAVIDA
jgi:hypothetical protein